MPTAAQHPKKKDKARAPGPQRSRRRDLEAGPVGITCTPLAVLFLLREGGRQGSLELAAVVPAHVRSLLCNLPPLLWRKPRRPCFAAPQPTLAAACYGCFILLWLGRLGWCRTCQQCHYLEGALVCVSGELRPAHGPGGLLPYFHPKCFCAHSSNPRWRAIFLTCPSSITGSFLPCSPSGRLL